MGDPTYDRERIDKNPVWRLAFKLSEMDNEIAPVGWSDYIYKAEHILEEYELKRTSQQLTDIENDELERT